MGDGSLPGRGSPCGEFGDPLPGDGPGVQDREPGAVVLKPLPFRGPPDGDQIFLAGDAVSEPGVLFGEFALARSYWAIIG